MPRAETADLQVRTGVSIAFSPHMRGREGDAATQTGDGHGRDATTLEFDPFQMGPTGHNLMMRHVLLAPVVVGWRYRIANEHGFKNWLSTREILLSQARMAFDPEVAGIRYGGTYRIGGGGSAAGVYKTMWGYETESAMGFMHALASDPSIHPTIVQSEIIDFINGMKRFIAEAGDEHFSQEVLIAASAG